MRTVVAALLCVAASAAHAGYACRDLSDPEGRRWFQDEPCSPGYRHEPLPDPPLIREVPPFGGYWVPAGTAVPFVTQRGGRGHRGGRR